MAKVVIFGAGKIADAVYKELGFAKITEAIVLLQVMLLDYFPTFQLS